MKAVGILTTLFYACSPTCAWGVYSPVGGRVHLHVGGRIHLWRGVFTCMWRRIHLWGGMFTCGGGRVHLRVRGVFTCEGACSPVCGEACSPVWGRVHLRVGERVHLCTGVAELDSSIALHLTFFLRESPLTEP